MTKKMIVLLTAINALCLSNVHAQYVPVRMEHAPVGDLKAVVPVSTDDRSIQSSKLQSIINMYNIVGQLNGSISGVKFVVYGKGVTLLQNPTPELQALIDKLRGLGAQFLVCNITLSSNQIDYRSLYKVQESDVVPSGTVEVVYLQQRQGYAVNPIN